MVCEWLEWESHNLRPVIYDGNFENESVVNKLLKKLENNLIKNEYVIGNEITLVDVIIFSDIFIFLDKIDFGIHIKKWLNKLEAHKIFSESIKQV